jgi:hypothetical protein
MTPVAIDVYRRQIEKELQAGNATEQTHRPALKALIESLVPGVTATNEPKRVECGAPDSAVTEKRAHGPVTIGQLEAKDVGKNLDEVKNSEQMRRYLPALPKKPIACYPVTGPNIVEKGFPKYLAPGRPEPGKGEPLAAGGVYIRKADPQGGAKGQYFEGIPPEVWSFQIGGYQVCKKWLKDPRGRTLTYDDLEHYCKVVTALSETIHLMVEIDAAIPKWPIE